MIDMLKGETCSLWRESGEPSLVSLKQLFQSAYNIRTEVDTPIQEGLKETEYAHGEARFAWTAI